MEESLEKSSHHGKSALWRAACHFQQPELDLRMQSVLVVVVMMDTLCSGRARGGPPARTARRRSGGRGEGGGMGFSWSLDGWEEPGGGRREIGLNGRESVWTGN